MSTLFRRITSAATATGTQRTSVSSVAANAASSNSNPPKLASHMTRQEHYSRTAVRSFWSSIQQSSSVIPRSSSKTKDVSRNNNKNGSTGAPVTPRTPKFHQLHHDHAQTHFYSTTSTIFQQKQAPPTSSPQGSAMKDEYGVMDDSGHTYVYDGDYALENGQVLPQAQLRYQTYGELNAARDNVIVVCHALTGNASLHSWWGGLLGPDLAFDTSKYFIVCCNILGSCYGSTGPMSINPTTGQAYGMEFPDISVKDTVRLQLLMLQNDLNIRSVKCVIGGSFGGMQALEYAVQGGSSVHADFRDADGNPFVRSVIPIACGAAHTAWQIAISEVQRQAIYHDPQWTIDPTKATSGLNVARQMGMVSYRTPQGYVSKFGRRHQKPANDNDDSNTPAYGADAKWQVKSYLEYQGAKFLSRFDPVTYVKMTEQMDSHDIARGREDTTDQVLDTIQIPALVMGIDSDVLYPIHEQEHMAEHLANSEFQVIHGDDGHDGFLLEQEQVGGHITDFMKRHQ